MEYSDNEKDEIGRQIITLFHIQRDPNHIGRYKTEWGNKTPKGIFELVLMLGQAIENGTIFGKL